VQAEIDADPSGTAFEYYLTEPCSRCDETSIPPGWQYVEPEPECEEDRGFGRHDADADGTDACPFEEEAVR
jgi:hypothetical protein